PSRAVAYLGPCLTILLPNLLLTGAVFFIMAALLRKILPVFLTAVIVLVGYLLGLSLTGGLENKTIDALVDPLGTLALNRLTEYWTLAERNERTVPLQGIFLANRTLWMSSAGAVFAVACWRFAFAHALEKGKGGARAEPETAEGSGERIAVLAADKSFSPASLVRLFFSSSWLQLTETVKNVYFAVIVAAGVLFMGTTALLVAVRIIV